MLLIISFFSVSPLHVSGGVCSTKDDSSERLQNSLTNDEGPNLDQWKITHLCCPFSTLLSTLLPSQEVLYVICIVIVNTIIVAQRHIQSHTKYLWLNFFEKIFKSQKFNCFRKKISSRMFETVLITPRQFFIHCK